MRKMLITMFWARFEEWLDARVAGLVMGYVAGGGGQAADLLRQAIADGEKMHVLLFAGRHARHERAAA